MTFVGNHILRAEKKGILNDMIAIATKKSGDDWHCIVKDGSLIIW